MKKQFLVSVIITIIGICSWSSGNNSLKACKTNATCFSTKTGKRVIDKSVKEKIDNYFSSGHIDYERNTYLLFMGPLIQM